MQRLDNRKSWMWWKKRNIRREELLEKYIIKMLYRQDDKKFKNKYLKKLERNW